TLSKQHDQPWSSASETAIRSCEKPPNEVESHTRTGPGLMFSSLIPDMDSFKGSEGGRALPMLHPDGQPNVAPGLLTALSRHFGREITVQELTAYIAGISAHPGYVEVFDEELHYSGNRVPLTADVEL